MKLKILTAICSLGLMSAAPAFAQGPGEHPNGTVQATMMASGDVMMTVTLPAKEYQAIDQAMKSSNVACEVKEMFPGAADTIVFQCDNADSTGG